MNNSAMKKKKPTKSVVLIVPMVEALSMTPVVKALPLHVIKSIQPPKRKRRRICTSRLYNHPNNGGTCLLTTTGSKHFCDPCKGVLFPPNYTRISFDRILVVPTYEYNEFPLASRDVCGEIVRLFPMKGQLVAVFASRQSAKSIAAIRKWVYMKKDMVVHWNAKERRIMRR